MGNSMNYVSKYSAEILDELFVANACSAVLELGDRGLLRFDDKNAKTVYIPSITMSGLGDYSRSDGFPKGGVEVTWEPHTLGKDRGIEFSIDAMDNEETAGVAYGKLANEFVRTKEVPEIDAYRFSTLYSKALNKAEETIAENGIIKKFNDVIEVFENNEVPTDEMFGFISTEINKMIKNTTELDKKISQADYKVGNINFKVRMYEDIPLITVPKPRFKTAYTFVNDPKGNHGEGGFSPSEGALDMNFLFVHKRAALPVMRHATTRVFAPNVNQSADAYKFQHRVYHDIFVPKNKQKGIYASVKPSTTTTEE